MGNCLETKLKENVANSNLLKKGEFRIHHTLVANKTGKIRLSKRNGDEPLTINVDGNYPFTVNDYLHEETVTSYTIPANSPREHLITFASGEYNIVISNKYDLTLLGFEGDSNVFWNSGLTLDVFKYCNYITNFNFSGVRDLSGPITDTPSSTVLNIMQFSSTNISGTMTQFGAALKGTVNMLTSAGSKITGDVIDFVTAQVDVVGRASCPESAAIRWIGLAQYHKFNNVTMTGNYGRLAWDSKNKIVVGTDALNFADCLNLYEKGYSAEEIATWNAAGKTVTDVVSGTVYPPTNA